MTSLSIKFNAGHGEDRVPARLRRIDIDGGQEDDWFQDLRIAPEETTTLDIDPGHYVVEAFWRDGRLTTQQCLIGSSSSELVLVPPLRRREPKPFDRDFSQPSAGGMSWSSRRSTGGHLPSVFMSNIKTWSLLCDPKRIERESQVTTTEHLPVRRQQDLQLSSDSQTSRNWVVYWASDAWALSSLPFTGAKDEEVTLRADPHQLPFIKASDPDMGVMTDMLPAGNSEAAHRYASVAYTHAQSHDLERIISMRPLELCAFAYAEYESFAEGSWTKALSSAAERHGSISDISVLVGWRMLMTAKDQDDWKAAGRLFEKAVQIGVPYFSLGVRLLAEGLTMIAPSLPDHEQSAGLVRSVAARVVPTEAFTTVRL